MARQLRYVSMFTPDFYQHVHDAVSLDVLVFAGLSNFTVYYLGHMLFMHA